MICAPNRNDKVLSGDWLAQFEEIFYSGTSNKRLNDWIINILYVVHVSNTKDVEISCQNHNFGESVDYIW